MDPSKRQALAGKVADAAFFIEFDGTEYRGESFRRSHGRYVHHDWLLRSDLKGSHQFVESQWREMKAQAVHLFYKGPSTEGKWAEKACQSREVFIEAMRRYDCPTID